MSEQYDFSMPLSEAITTQRAMRRLKPDPVDDKLIMQLIELALKAPSGANGQNWEFIVVKDREVKRKIGHRNRQIWSLYRKIGDRVRVRDKKTQKTVDAVQWQADHFEEIPVIVVACLRGVRVPFPHIWAATYFGSIFPSVQNFLLAARSVNLGAVLITFPLWNVISLRRILGLPGNITPCALIPLGWPEGNYGPTTRRPVEKVVSFDTYGNRREKSEVRDS